MTKFYSILQHNINIINANILYLFTLLIYCYNHNNKYNIFMSLIDCDDHHNKPKYMCFIIHSRNMFWKLKRKYLTYLY